MALAERGRMCGRFTIQYTWAEYHDALSLIPASAKGRNDPPRYNVCPSQAVGALIRGDDDYEVIDPNWGFIPFWAKEKKFTPINAKGETVATNGMFRTAFACKRCLIPANSYYEWVRPDPKTRLPYNIHLKDNAPFFFAGIWGTNENLDALTCAIITTVPNEGIAHIHDRMPVILREDVLEQWMDPDTEVERAHALLEQNRGTDLVAYRVSTDVNSNRAKGAQLIDPIDA
jgi:putative SOS response-associated peptidase YedK